MSASAPPSPTARSSGGFSLIELLVAMVVFVTVLSMASVFFARQTQLQRAVQARNDVQDRVRVMAQLVTQDLALAGASLRIGADGRIDTAAGSAGCAQVAGVPLCADATRVSDTATTLRVRYLSSQFASADACRDVAYRLAGGTMQRSDVSCGAGDAFLELAPDVLGFKVVIVCSDNVTRTEDFGVGSCSSNAYGRSAVVSIAAQSTIRTTGPSTPLVLTTADGNGVAVPCPEDRVCYGINQEVLLPNLKDR